MKGKLKKIIIISTCIMFFVSLFIFLKQHKELSYKYGKAVEYAESGDYVSARNIIGNIGEYKDSSELLQSYTDEIDYQLANRLIEEEDYEKALTVFERLNAENRGYKDSIDLQYQVEYMRAVKRAAEGDLNGAYEAFKRLPISYSDVIDRLNELSHAIKFADKWYCKEHKIDLIIKAKVSEDNVTYLETEIRDREGFLIGNENNKLFGSDLVLNEDRFVWNILGDETKFAIIMENNKLKVAKQPVKDNNYIVTFARKLDAYNSVDGDIDAAVKRSINNVK